MFKKPKKTLYIMRRDGVKFDQRMNHHSQQPMTKRCECCGTEDMEYFREQVRREIRERTGRPILTAN